MLHCCSRTNEKLAALEPGPGGVRMTCVDLGMVGKLKQHWNLKG